MKVSRDHPKNTSPPNASPLTAQKGLTLEQQLMLDAFNLDQLREYAEYDPLDDEERNRLLELEDKMRNAEGLRKE